MSQHLAAEREREVLESPAVLKYLDLPKDYTPSHNDDALEFLKLHISVLPLYLLRPFSNSLTPRQRTSIPLIKNRRTNYVFKIHPQELEWDQGRILEPLLWENMNAGAVATPSSGSAHPRPGIEAGAQEREWAEHNFVGYHNVPSRSGSTGEQTTKKGYVGRIGELLAEYEEEREAERLRALRRDRMAAAAIERETEEELDTDSSDDEFVRAPSSAMPQDELESTDEVRSSFERLLRERFIDGFLPVSWAIHLTAMPLWLIFPVPGGYV